MINWLWSVSFGGISLDLGETCAPAFDLVDATGYKTVTGAQYCAQLQVLF